MGGLESKSIRAQLEQEFPNLPHSVIERCANAFEGPLSAKMARCRAKLRELNEMRAINANEQLKRLDQLFPLVAKSELRRCISKSKNNILLAADALLNSHVPKLSRRVELRPHDRFRAADFCQALQHTMCNRYPMLWQSAIEQVLLEHNYEPARCIEVLDELERNRVPGWFDWLERPDFTVKKTDEFARELRFIQQAEDFEYARKVNTREYIRLRELIECNCCYGEFAYEDLRPCSEGSHLFCLRCLESHFVSLTTGSYGLKVTLKHAQSPKCFSCDLCEGVIAREYWPAKQVEAIDEFLKTHNLSGQLGPGRAAPLLCPFCGDQVRNSRSCWQVLIDQPRVLFLILSLIYVICWRLVSQHMFGFLELLFVILLWACSFTKYRAIVQPTIRATEEFFRKLRATPADPPDFMRCVNPQCSVAVCGSCQGEADINHQCFEDVPDEASIELFQSYVSSAMNTVAVRICPKCLLQFQKADGCNRIQCQCGYEMCYLCRQQVSDYRHFCVHFRATAGEKCKECQKCELWKVDDDPKVAESARQAAILYVQKHPAIMSKLKRPVRVQGIVVLS